MIRAATPDDAVQVVDIWRAAVLATQDFLDPDDRIAIEAEVRQHLPAMVTWVSADMRGRLQGFMAITGAHVDALFVDPFLHGQGIGRALLAHVSGGRGPLTVDVNAQNVRAVGFYERLGFRTVGRSDRDDQGRPYPLLHMRRDV